MKKTGIPFIIVLLILPLVLSEDVYIANSASWQNVYSAGIFSSIQDKTFLFLTSAKHTETILNDIPKSTHITIIESSKIPYARNYANRLTSAGYNANTILIPENTGNLDLAKRLTNITNYIVVSPTYGYNAISLAPYSKITNSYVLFASTSTIDEVSAFLHQKKPTSLILFGDLDTQVINSLNDLNPTIINEGNRYKNNLVIAQKVQAMVNPTQAILTNGEFLEQDIFTAGKTNQPLIFIGRDRVPDSSFTYLKGASGYKAFVVLGNDLFGSAQQIKKSTNVQTIIKFAKGVVGEGGFKTVSGLDIFPTPQLELLLTLDGIYYNADTQTVEMIVKNEKPARTFAQNSIIVQDGNTPIVTLGDDTGTRLDGNEIHAYTFPEDLTNYVNGNLTAQIVIPYGESADTIERAITVTMPIPVFSEKDVCNVDITKATYDKETQRFRITLTTDKQCYVLTTITNLTVNDTQVNVQSEIQPIESNTIIEIKQRMDAVDIADNPTITINARFGNAQNILLKQTAKTFPLKIEGALGLPIIIGISAILLFVILIALILWKRKQRRQ